MPNGTPVETRSPGAGQSSIDCTVDYLVLEMVRYYAVGQDLVAAVHAVETMGFRIGFQLAERLTEGMARMEEPLAKMKFVCKEFWTALLGHHAGGLKTNHKGRFIIDDNNLRWLTPLAVPARDKNTADVSSQKNASNFTRQRVADLYVTLAAGCLKGALFHLNLTCSVAGSTSKAPACMATSTTFLARTQLHDIHVNTRLGHAGTFTIEVQPSP